MARWILWRVGWRLGWALAAWAIRSQQAKRRSRGLIGRAVTFAVAWDRSLSRRLALSVLPVPRWVIELGAHLGDLWLWTLIGGALLWRWAGKWWLKRTVRALMRLR